MLPLSTNSQVKERDARHEESHALRRYPNDTRAHHCASRKKTAPPRRTVWHLEIAAAIRGQGHPPLSRRLPAPSVGEDNRVSSAEFIGHLMIRLLPDILAEALTFRLVPTS